MMISRFFQKKVTDKKFDPSAELEIVPWLNSIFMLLLRAELGLLSKNVNFPVGGSRLVVARKNGIENQNFKMLPYLWQRCCS